MSNTATKIQPKQQQFAWEVIQGLSKNQKQLPSKYFYDSEGPRLFDAICELDEYYPYRTELAMLPTVSQEVNHKLNGPHHIVEFGAGSLIKIRLLLNNCDQALSYTPIDIAQQHLLKACHVLQQEIEHINVQPVVADFTQQVALPDLSDEPKLGFFPGSTIGNFTPADAVDFLSQARHTLGNESYLLIGVDLKKDPELLHQAYNDEKGITAAFNKNMLTRINRELDGNFNTQQFHHYAFYNAPQGRVEMHLVSDCDQVVKVGTQQFSIGEGESIHTENSHKFSVKEFQQLAQQAGWVVEETWTDNNRLFSVHLLKAA